MSLTCWKPQRWSSPSPDKSCCPSVDTSRRDFPPSQAAASCVSRPAEHTQAINREQWSNCGGTRKTQVLLHSSDTTIAVFCVAVRPYHPTPPTTALAEGAGASRVQACHPCLQVSAADSAIVPLRRTMPAGRLWGSTSSAVSLIIITGCPSYAVVYHRRSCFSGRCRTYLERSAAARHVCTLAACFSQSSEDAPLQTLLSVTPSSVFVVPVKWLVIIGHVNHSFYLLT